MKTKVEQLIEKWQNEVERYIKLADLTNDVINDKLYRTIARNIQICIDELKEVYK
jgi:hypothetical protein